MDQSKDDQARGDGDPERVSFELYDRLYTDWTHIDKTVKKDNGAGEATERLWISPKTIKQETLFDLEVRP
jgi:hypothetical protein